MIQANELRIGNYILSNNNEWVKVESILSSTMRIYAHYGGDDEEEYLADFSQNDLSPIPLTTEILENCGFEKRERMSDRWAFLEGYYSLPIIGRSIVVGFDNGKCKLFHYLESFMGNSIDELCELTSLHHFQNAVHALTGEDLPMNLK